MIWYILISESVSVYGRYVVGLSSSIVLMIGFQSVPCRLSIGLKSGDSIPSLTRNDTDMNPTGFTVSSATLSVADSWPIHWTFCGFCRFCVGLAGVIGVSVLSVWCRFMFGQTNLSGRDLSNMFERSLPDKLSVVCRFYVGVVSVFCRGAFGDVSVLIRPPMIDGLMVCWS